MREIVFDTETTGLDPEQGDRLVEIGCIELINRFPTGNTFHRYINPERPMPEAALAVHGLSDEFLAKHPTFAHFADELLTFIADDRLVIHNAEFDIRFIDAELARLGRPPLDRDFEDTLLMARRRYPGAPASLDALCKRFNIDNSLRDKHGARLDCELLAAVYLELIGGRQPGLDLAALAQGGGMGQMVERIARPPRAFPPSAVELAAHAAFLAKLKAPLWLE